MVVISLGGSTIFGEAVDVDYIKKFREFMDSYREKIYLVVGGGKTAREYISLGKNLKMNEYTLDKIGIMATRLNSYLFITEKTYPDVATSIEETIIAGKMYKNVVMGGTEPGHTTDGVSLLLAERIGEKKVINITSVGGIYNKDPKIHKNAKIIKKMRYEDAKKLLMERKMDAGLNIPIDLLSLNIAERSEIEIRIVGKDIENLKRAINDEDYKGTVIGNFNP